MSEISIKKEIFNLESIIAYQEDSIVSRTLVNKEVGTVTLFSFDIDQGLSEHTAPYDALAYLIDGDAEITISSVKYILTRGQMIIMPANEPHALKALKKFKMMLIMIKS
ncbi:hypothetical protein LCGC14_1298480 [marine sediment metagenome]|uniref:Cupin type-2 domain-containing protein n=1 Tax=marine sediment metagenome TaxID=412755 RepID=A0A0F9N6Y6_9ZZZZ